MEKLNVFNFAQRRRENKEIENLLNALSLKFYLL